MQTSPEQATAHVFLADNTNVVLINGSNEVLRIPILHIKLIGEYTTSAGPFADDWFIVFMTSEKDWYQVSEYTPGMLEMLKQLGHLLEAEVMCSLFGSTIWKTNIIWPPRVAGQEIWNLLSEQPNTLLGKLKKAMGLDSQQLVLTKAAVSVLN